MHRLATFMIGEAEDEPVLAAARQFAERFGSRLDVCHPMQDSFQFYAMSQGAVIDTSEEESSRDHTAQSAFATTCGDYDKAYYFASKSDMEDAISGFGLYYDGIVLGRLTEEEGPSAGAFNTAMFEIGAPVIIVPPQNTPYFGTTAAIVWTGTPQAARALRAALPVLQEFRQVYILTNTDNSQAEPELLTAYLNSYDIDPLHRTFDGSQLTARGRGRAIISACLDIGADFMVMGAFGESRLDAIFGLGRTTRKLVTAAPIPLLMHH